MPLYRANPRDGVAWITGASTGIGRALALRLAVEGYTVAATARSEENLASLAKDASGLAGRVVPFPGDVTDEAAMAVLVKRIEVEAGSIVLAVFSAGTYLATRGERLHLPNFSNTFELNLLGVVNCLVPLTERMRERGRGQVAFVASVTGYFGWPSAAAYGASKAALNNMAEALKFDFDKMNIRIQVINPGFIDTPLTQKNSFRMPALMPVNRAAERLAAALRSGGFECSFPRRFTLLLKVLRLLPQPLRFAFINRVTGWNKRPLATAKRPAGDRETIESQASERP
jgi:NAD(P)-dependent dehydrogenase (short-subunit alcohol dehydrogenase family)